MKEHNLDQILEQIRECDTTKPYIFISYTSANQYEAWSDALELQRRGYNVWLDEKNIDKTKKDWRDDCIEAIRNMYCAMVLFYLSEYSITSKNCLDEMRTVEDNITKKRHNGRPVPLCPIDVEPIANFVAFTDHIYETIYHDPQLPYEEKTQKVETLEEMKEIFFPKGNDRVRIRSRRIENRHPSYYSDLISQLQKRKIKPLYPPQPKKDEKKTPGNAPAKTAEKTPKEPQTAAAAEQKEPANRENAGPSQALPHASGQQPSSDGRDPTPASFAESLRIPVLTGQKSPAKSEEDEAKEAPFPSINTSEETSKDLPPAIIIEGGEDVSSGKPEASRHKNPAGGKQSPANDRDAIARKFAEMSRQYNWNNQTSPENKSDKDETNTVPPSVSHERPRPEDVTPEKPEPVRQPKPATNDTPSSAEQDPLDFDPLDFDPDKELEEEKWFQAIIDRNERKWKRKRSKAIGRWAVFLQFFAAAAAVAVFIATNAVTLNPLQLVSPIALSAASAFFIFLAFYGFSAVSTGLAAVNKQKYAHSPKVKNWIGFSSCFLLMAGILSVAMICGKATFKEASAAAALAAIAPFLFWLTSVLHLSFSNGLSARCTARFMIFGGLRNCITVVLFFFLLQTDISHFWVAVLLAVPTLLLIWGSTKPAMKDTDTAITGIPLLLFWLLFRIACYVILGEHDGFWMNLLAALGYNLPTFLISLLCIFLSI